MTSNTARDPAIAEQEESRAALDKGTIEALDLFIARHPDGKIRSAGAKTEGGPVGVGPLADIVGLAIPIPKDRDE